ncbi:ATP-binding protein [Haliangium sp.]|uniref:PAS domain-containing sensor histidine kinase n=1 Tax=Haliangium sp. TaxID=2663208 RepID=UPI003D10775A
MTRQLPYGARGLFSARADDDEPIAERTLLEAALGFAAATVLVLDQAGLVVQVATVGNKRDWLGMHLPSQMVPAGPPSFEARLQDAVAHDRATEFEARASFGDDDTTWYRLALQPGPHGHTLAVMKSIDRERQARIENQRFRAVLDQANEGIFVVDPRTTRFVDVNDTACRMLRYTRPELLTLGPQDIEIDFALHTREQWIDYMLEVMAVGTLPYEGVHRRKDGSTYPVETTWSIKPFEGDEYLLGVCRDITEKRRIQADLRQAEETLRVSDRLTTVGTMAAGIMHEINNPLSYVSGNIEFCEDRLQELPDALPRELHAEMLQALREAGEGTDRMSRIVRDLRTFSRRDDDSVSAVGVHEVLESSINIAMNQIRQRAGLERDFGDRLHVMANEPRLGQVFLNLLINAAQAIPPGDSAHQRIVVRARRDGEDVLVEIRDTGAGMSEQVMARIFDPFFTTKPIGVGTGLGLSICKNIVESLSGTISVASARGRGTTFSIRLPAAADAPASPARRLSDADGRRAGTYEHVPRGRVLVIDDDERAARALRRYLSHHQGEVETDARRALERFLSESFDAVFCEISMPDFGGLDFYHQVALRAAERLPRLVLVRSGPLAQPAEEFLANSEVACTSKPYDADEVRRLVEERLE